MSHPDKPFKRYDVVVFDWEGTLADSCAQVVALAQQAAKNLALEPPDEKGVRSLIGLGIPEVVLQLYPELSHRDHKALQGEFEREYGKMRGEPEHQQMLFTGVKEGLAQLHEQGFLIAIATGASRRVLDESLENHKLKGFIAASRTPDEAHSKPHPDMLLQILDELGVDACQAVMVGDSVYDLQMAQNAATDAVAVTYGNGTEESLAEYPAVARVESFQALMRLLGTES